MSRPIQIIGGKYQGHSIEINSSRFRLEIRHAHNPQVIIGAITLLDIASLETLTTQTVNPADTAVFGTIGFMLGGPVGAAGGAGISRMTRECTYVITMKDGEKHICKSWRKFFDLITTKQQIALASPELAQGASAHDLPDAQTMTRNKAETDNQPVPIPLFWKCFFWILALIVLLNMCSKS